MSRRPFRLAMQQLEPKFALTAAPTDITLAGSAIAENAAVGATVGTLSTIDANVADTFTYALVAGEGSVDNSAFTIAGNTLKAAASFNFEAKNSYSIRVKSTDSDNLSTEKQFTISVTDVAEPLAIDRIGLPASRLYKANEVLQFRVVLTRPVTVVGRPEMNLTIGRSQAKAVYQSGSGSNQLVFNYTVRAGDNDADGIALGNSIVLPRGSSIRFESSSLPLALPVVNTSGIRVDTAPPRVNALAAPANGSYKAGQVLRFTATLSEAVTVTGVPTLPLVIGTTARQAAYVAGSSSPTSLVFEYTVQAGETDANGIAVGGRTIVLPAGASIVDAAGNAANLGVTPPNLSRVLVDSAGPLALSITPPAANTYVPNRAIDLVVNFNEDLVVTGSPTLPVQIGSAARTAAFVGFQARSNRSLVFRVTPQAGDVDTNGVAITGPLGLAGAVIADKAGNAAAGTLPNVNLSRVLVDGIGPTITSVDDLDFDGSGRPIVRVRFNEPVQVSGTPTIPFQLGGSPRQLIYVGGNKSSVLTFRYSPQKTDNFDNEITYGSVIVLGAGGRIADSLGNALASLTLP